jgi:hypothetical protein
MVLVTFSFSCYPKIIAKRIYDDKLIMDLYLMHHTVIYLRVSIIEHFNFEYLNGYHVYTLLIYNFLIIVSN